MCVGVLVPGKGAVIGTDGRLSEGDRIITDSFSKVRRFGDAIVSFCGVPALDWAKGAKSWAGVVLKARNHHADIGLEHGVWELFGYDEKTQRLLATDTLNEVDVGNRYATGSGGMFALGALEVLPVPESLDEAAKHVRAAIRVAIARSMSCGGQIRILRSDRK